ncbi:unnamed protein product [Arabidopsis thaliana]|uniref:Uncharacterized protein n=1 Tax=Arabidopsis thaliana TaxID=3702 RepID=A0A5S9WXY5_ARATH|nr:unnamed protein product [Arabidopsis thaliana]
MAEWSRPGIVGKDMNLPLNIRYGLTRFQHIHVFSKQTMNMKSGATLSVGRFDKLPQVLVVDLKLEIKDAHDLDIERVQKPRRTVSLFCNIQLHRCNHNFDDNKQNTGSNLYSILVRQGQLLA